MSSFMNQRGVIEDLLEQKENIIKKAANAVSIVLMEYNRDGMTDTKAIKNNIDKLLKGFTEEEKLEILKISIAKLVANL